jgi:host factor-I protein
MPSENPQRLQDTFLDHLLQKRVPVTLFLVNGVKLQGIVTGHDAFCIMLARDGQSQAVYKQAISTIAPGYAVDLWEGGDKEKGEGRPESRPEGPPPRRVDLGARREKVVVVERKPRARRPL